MKLANKVTRLHEKMDPTLAGYLAALLFAGMDDNDDPLDDNYSVSDVSKDAIKKSEKDIAKFKKSASKELEGLDVDDSQIGHDILLSRNGHGAGFFDRDYADKKVLDKLQAHAEKLGSVDAYVSDGEIEV